MTLRYFLVVFLGSLSSLADCEQAICSNGENAGKLCRNDTKGTPMCENEPGSWCEQFHDFHLCCSPSKSSSSSSDTLTSTSSPALCFDRSSFCKLTKHLCSIRSDFQVMKSKCDKSCGFCGFDTFDEAFEQRDNMKILMRESQKCDDPRKCTWPKKIVFNETTPSSKTTSLEDILGASSTSSDSTRTYVYSTSSKSTVTHDPNASLRAVSSKTRQVTLPRGFGEIQKNSTTSGGVKKVTMEELMSTTVDDLPIISTAEPDQLVTSFKKTVIKGTCYDEYIYCREAINLCSHPAFSDVMASHCSLTCGRCDDIDRPEIGTENCADVSEQCSTYTDLCDDSKYSTLMSSYCPKSCGHCVPLCRDRHQNCPQFKEDGFCHDQMYTDDEIKYLCGSTCQMC